MKKIKNCILALVISLCMLPMIARADMGAPMVTPYEVVITNPDGVTIGYGNNKVTIPFDTKVTVNYDYEQDGVLYGSVSYDDTYGEIKLSDAKVYTTNIDLNNFRKLDKPLELYVFKEGAYLYNGPSAAYGKVKGEVMIPVGTTISYSYYDEMWIYVEYKGTKGWLYNNASSKMYSGIEVATAYPIKDTNKILAIDTVTKIYDVPEYSAKEGAINIPAGTELTYDLYVWSGRTKYVHVKYDGKEGWLAASEYFDGSNNGIVSEKACSDGIVMEDVAIYSKVNDLSSATGEKIPRLAKVHLIYSFRNDNSIWNKVIYKNKEVWIALNNADYNDYMPIAYSGGSISTYTVTEKADIYEEPSYDSKVIGKLNMDDKFSSSYSYYASDASESWVYYKKGNVEGWVNYSRLTFVETKQDTTCKALVDSSPSEDEKEDGKETSENKLLKAALIAGGIAVVIGLTITVTVVLVNKKKKNN